MIQRLTGLALFSLGAFACPFTARGAVNDWTNLVQFPSIVRDLAVDPSTSSTIYAGTNGNGVFKSTDGGLNWNPAGLTTEGVLCLAIDPVTPSTIYAATYSGVYKSIDSGATWNLMSTGLTTLASQYPGPCIAIDPTTPSTLYVGTNGGGVFKSIDGAANWNAANTGLTDLDIASLVLDPGTPSILYAATAQTVANGTGSGVFKTVDGAANWTASSTGLVDLDTYSLAIDPVATSTLYVNSGDGGYRSTDGGQNWILRNPAVGGKLVVDPANSGTVYTVVVAGFERTVNGWATKSSMLTPAFTDTNGVLALAVDPSAPNVLYAGTFDGYVFKAEIDLCGTAADCDDGNLCTADACDPADSSADIAGCTHTPSACVCSSTPLGGCTALGKSILLVKDKNEDGAGASDKLIWKWLRGPATMQSDFGDPTVTAQYSFCLYTGTAQTLAMEAHVPADGTCDSTNCWSPISDKGYKRKDKDASTDGISLILLKGSDVASAKIIVKGKDGNLDLTPSTLPLDASDDVIAQLSNSDNSNCWQGTFPSGSIKKNIDALFKAKTP